MWKNSGWLAALCLVCLLESVQAAGWLGHLESRVQADNHYGEHDQFIQHWGEFSYEHNDNLQLGIAAAARVGIAGIEGQLQQAWLRKTWPHRKYSLLAGRFEQADLSGFYALDGARLEHQREQWSWRAYAGVRRQIEYFVAQTEKPDEPSHALLGLETEYKHKRLSARLGFEHHATNPSGDLFNLDINRQFDKLHLSTAASLDVHHHQIEHFLIRAQSAMDWAERPVHFTFSYETYQPLNPLLSFRQRFYRLYARGRQSGLSARAQYKTQKDDLWRVEGRKLWRDFGDSGYAVSIDWQSHKPQRWQSRLDCLTLADEKAINWFVALEKPLSSRHLATFSSVIQWKHSQLLKPNWATGASVNLKYKYQRDMFINFFAEYIAQTQMDNQYQLGIQIQYDFYAKRYRP